VIENQSHQEPSQHGAMSSLDTAKKGLELVEGIVYVGRDACERPYGLGSCVVLGFGDLPRYTGVIIFQEIVECSSRMRLPTTRHF
ncbi:hypothetical protein C2W62_31680, partial [Candidatus Entotheonella serta]